MDTRYYAEQISDDVLGEILSISFLSDKVARQIIMIAHLVEKLAETKHGYDCMDAELSREIDELKRDLKTAKRKLPMNHAQEVRSE